MECKKAAIGTKDGQTYITRPSNSILDKAIIQVAETVNRPKSNNEHDVYFAIVAVGTWIGFFQFYIQLYNDPSSSHSTTGTSQTAQIYHRKGMVPLFHPLDREKQDDDYRSSGQEALWKRMIESYSNIAKVGDDAGISMKFYLCVRPYGEQEFLCFFDINNESHKPLIASALLFMQKFYTLNHY